MIFVQPDCPIFFLLKQQHWQAVQGKASVFGGKT
jgi:hypothetical protein